jgi:HK97 family phage major capsid protein
MANETLGLTQQRSVLQDEADKIVAAAETGKRGMTKDERTKLEGLCDDIEGLDATLRGRARLAALAAGRDGGSTGRAVPFVSGVHDLSLEKPFGYDKCPQLWVDGYRTRETKEEREYRIHTGFGEQLQEIRRAELVRAEQRDHRLDTLNAWYEKRSTPSGMSEQVPADGGYLIYPDFSQEVLRLTHETGAVYNMGRRIPISDATNAIKIPAIDQTSRVDGSRWGGVRAFWMNEADALTGSKPKFRLLELVTKKLGVLYYATDEIVADSVALGSITLQAFAEEFGFKLDDAAINGDGDGKPMGVANSANPSLIVVNKESGQAASTILWANILKMWFRLWLKSRRNACWFVNQDVEQQIVQLYNNSTASASVVAGVAPYQGGFSTVQPIYTPAGYLQSQTATLMGRPMYVIEQCASLTSQGDIILADMSQWIYLDKGAPQTAASMHVRFLNDEMTYRSIFRVDGMPWWNNAITPFNGSATVSPFITLQAR